MNGYAFYFTVQMHLLKGQKYQIITIKFLILELPVKFISCLVLFVDTQCI